MILKVNAFIEKLIDYFPELLPIFNDHIVANIGEILPHVLLGDISRYVVLSIIKTKDPIVIKHIAAIINYIEEAFTEGEEELRELIVVSFLENMPLPGEIGAEVRQMFGPNLTKQMNLIG